MAYRIKVQGDHDDVIGLLVASGASVDRRGLEGRTPLYLAARKGNVDTVAALLQAASAAGRPDAAALSSALHTDDGGVAAKAGCACASKA